MILFKGYKTELDPTKQQIDIINKTINACVFVYNFYINYNQELYYTENKHLTGREFSVWLNNYFLVNNNDYSWIKKVSSKAIKQSIENAHKAYRKFLKGEKKFPTEKRKAKMYFVRNSSKSTICCERHKIKIPCLGWVKLKEKGYLPATNKGIVIISGYVSCVLGRYYVSVLVNEDTKNVSLPKTKGIGIDVGIKNYAVLSSGKVYMNINKTERVKKLEKQIITEKRQLSRKYESNKRQKKKKGDATKRNIQKQELRIALLYQKLTRIRHDYFNKVINEIVKDNPEYITVENLNVIKMSQKSSLAKNIYDQSFKYFYKKLRVKCHENNIEFRCVSKYYPSSKKCNRCGKIKNVLLLNERIFKCDCGYENDRDFNASLNLRDAKEYKVL